ERYAGRGRQSPAVVAGAQFVSNFLVRRSRRAALLLELGAVAALATLYLTLGSGRPRFVDVLVGAVAVAAIALDARRTRRLWAEADALAPGLAPPPLGSRSGWFAAGAFTAAALAVLAALDLATADSADGTPGRFGNWHLLPAIALYFPWAYLQQFVFQFYLLPRLLHLLPVGIAVATTGLAF